MGTDAIEHNCEQITLRRSNTGERKSAQSLTTSILDGCSSYVCHTVPDFQVCMIVPAKREPVKTQFTPDPAFMQRAIHLATQNVLTGRGGPFAALIVREGVVIAEAANSVTATNDPTAHGEVNAIRKACGVLGRFTLEGCEIYTSCEPCPMCLGAIYWARISTIYYGNDCVSAHQAGFSDFSLYEQFKLDRSNRSIASQQLLKDEAWDSFKMWLESPNRIDY